MLPSGLRSWRTTLGGLHARVHLRAEPDGTALALLNASSAVRLTASGAAMVSMVLDGEDDRAIIKTLKRSFDAPRDRLARDLLELRDTLARLAAAPGGSFPIEDLTDGRGARTSALSAPLEAWVEMAPIDALIPRIDALWGAAVPHITLLATTSTVADDLVRAVERAEDLGMICGIRGLGSALPRETLTRCAEAGVDCVQVPLLANTDAAHDQILGTGERRAAIDALVACRDLEVCPIAEVPLVDATADHL
ncbi:MAG: hypothetical protein KDA24_28620, partial [Deltaproteobacteria bacterium]|nr:hypothetical protein [Deltaproteobacteria bacterium]